MCHLVLLLPVLGITVFWVWPLSVALPLYLLILTISTLAYGVILRAMHGRVTTGREGLLEEVGEVLGAAGDGWSVRIHGEIWHASSAEPLEPHDRVTVAGMDGLTLCVRKIASGSDQEPERSQI